MSKVRAGVMNPDPYLNIEEAAQYLNVTVRWMRRRIEEDAIRKTKHGREWKFRRSWLEEYSASHEEPAEVQS